MQPMDDVDDADYLWIAIQQDAVPPVVAARGEVDAASSPRLLAGIDEAVALGSGVAVDLSEVTFIDSSGLRALTEALRRSEREGFGFRVSSMSESVRRVFDLTGMTPLLAP